MNSPLTAPAGIDLDLDLDVNFDFGSLTFLIDMDSVLCDWDKQFQADTLHFAHLLPEDYFTRPAFNLFGGLNAELSEQILSAMNRRGFYADLEPMPGAAEALNRMLDIGINVAIVTSPWLTNPTCVQDKVEWLERYIGAGWSERIVVTKDKTLVRGHVLVDDKPRIIGGMIPDWEHVYFTQRYNQHLPGRRLDAWAGWERTLLVPFVTAAAARA